MSTNLTAPTDEPFSCPSNRLSRSPDEDPGTARHAQNDARGLVATAPRSLSSLPTEILQNIFTQLHHLTRVPRLATKGFRIELRYTQLDKCIFGIAKPIWMSLFILPPDAIEPTGKLVQDPVLAAFLDHTDCAAGVREAVIRLERNTFSLACLAVSKLSHLTTLDIDSWSEEAPDSATSLVVALKRLTSLRSLRLGVVPWDAPWDQLRLDRDLPLLRDLDVVDEKLFEALAPGFSRLTRLTIGHFAMGRNHVPWRTLRYLEINPEEEAFEPAQFIDSLTSYMCEPANPALPLEGLVFTFPTLRQADEVETDEAEFCQADLYHIFRNLRLSSLRSLSLSHIDSFKWTQPNFLLPSVTLLHLGGTCDFTSKEEFDHFLAFVHSFPMLQELRLSQFGIFTQAVTDPTPTSLTADAISRLSSRQLASIASTLVILLFSLQSTTVTKFVYRENGHDSKEMRWQREPGGAFKGELWSWG